MTLRMVCFDKLLTVPTQAAAPRAAHSESEKIMASPICPSLIILSGLCVLPTSLPAKDSHLTLRLNCFQSELHSPSAETSASALGPLTSSSPNRDRLQPGLVTASVTAELPGSCFGPQSTENKPASNGQEPSKTRFRHVVENRPRQISAGDRFPAADTLTPLKDGDKDAQTCLDGLCWKNA